MLGVIPGVRGVTLTPEYLKSGAPHTVFPTGQVGQAAAKPSLAYGNSLGPGLARAYRLCKA